jgi:hypothetical protein
VLPLSLTGTDVKSITHQILGQLEPALAVAVANDILKTVKLPKRRQSKNKKAERKAA